MSEAGERTLSAMYDEQIEEYLQPVPCAADLSTDNEVDFDSDDSLDDPDWSVSFSKSKNHIKEAMVTTFGNLFPSTSTAYKVEEALQEAITEAEVAEVAPQAVPAEQPQVIKTRTRPSKRARSVESQEEEEGPVGPTSGTFIGDVLAIKNNSDEFRKIAWKNKSLQLHKNEVVFRGNSELLIELPVLETPYHYFMYFLTEDLLEKLAQKGNLYARQHDINTRFTTSANEM